MKMTSRVKSFNQFVSRGYTLVELMVGMFISLLVGAVALTYLVSSSRMLSNQNAEEVVQENARFALEMISSVARLAGSNESDNIQTVKLDYPVNQGLVCSGADCNYDNQPLSLGGASIETDSIALNSIVSRGVTCTGFDLEDSLGFATEYQLVTVFYVDDPDNDGVSSLFCQAYIGQYDYINQSFSDHVAPNNPVPLLDGVEMLQVQYGLNVDEVEDGTGAADIEAYKRYDPNWTIDGNSVGVNKIRALKIGLLIGNSQSIDGQQNTEKSEARTFKLLDAERDANDSVLRQSYTTTVFLPNGDKPNPVQQL